MCRLAVQGFGVVEMGGGSASATCMRASPELETAIIPHFIPSECTRERLLIRPGHDSALVLSRVQCVSSLPCWD